MSFLIGQVLGQREFARDLLIVLQLLLVCGGSDDRHILRPPLFRLADVDKLHAVAFRCKLLPPGGELRIVGKMVIVTDVEAERFLRSGELGGGC